MTWWKSLFPRGIKRNLRRVHRRRILDQGLRELLALPAGTLPDRDLLRRLQYGWGNRGYVADQEYLHLIADTLDRLDGPILECGSGLSTLLMGALAGPRGLEVVSLEHHEAWFEHVRSFVDRCELTAVRLHLAPLEEHDGFDWYSIPPSLPEEPFALAVCDGPPEKTTRGARYGLLPLMLESLAPGCTILMDDADRRAQAEVIERWREIVPEMKVQTRTTRHGASAVLSLPSVGSRPTRNMTLRSG